MTDALRGPERSIWLGPRCLVECGPGSTADTGRRVGEESDRSYRSCTRRPIARLGAEPDVVLLVAVAELRDRHAADQDRAASRRSFRPGCPGRWPPHDRRPPAPRACAARASCRGPTSPRLLLQLGSISWSEYFASPSRSGPAVDLESLGRPPPWNGETSLTLARRSG